MTQLAISTPPTSPLNGNFSGHETFPFRYAWLKKGIDGLTRQPDIFNRDEALIILGVGKNMVRSIRHWCLATQIIEEGDYLPSTRTRRLSPTELGRSLFLEPGWDKYLEDTGSLWLLHWQLATNGGRATTWQWAFNELREAEFTRDSLYAALERYVNEKTWSRVSEASLRNDLSCFLRTYVPGRRGPASTAEETLDCPLTTLGLITERTESSSGGMVYRFNTGPKSTLPPAVFTYALLDCWNNYHRNQETLSLREILTGIGSPGRVFRLDADSVLSYLDSVFDVTEGRLLFEDTALIRQVVRRSPIEKSEVLSAYYRI